MTKLSLVLLFAAAACSKSAPPADKQAGSATGSAAVAAPADKPAEAPPAAPAAPAAPESTDVLDLTLQRVPVAGGAEIYRIASPRVSLDLKTRPQVSKEMMTAPDGTPIPSGMALSSSANGADGFLYLPIPKDREYNVETGIKGARDGFLKMFDPGYTAKDSPAKLGPLDATYVVADGTRGELKLHVEAWLAWDAEAYTMYGVMALRQQGDSSGIKELHQSFKLSAAPAAGSAAPAR